MRARAARRACSRRSPASSAAAGLGACPLLGLGLKAKEIIGTLIFAPSIWTLEIDGNLPKIWQSRPRSRTSPKVVWAGVAQQVDLTSPTERHLERGQLECRCSERQKSL